ncbi:hypothetical protein KDA14_05410, partial [Candidatus Saccharibacteria bacterium]|nr:hypothetical protein [Candidatus Saccharibacteria bacterium]
MTNVHHQTPAEALVHPDAQSGYGWFDLYNKVPGEVESNGNTVHYDLFEPDDPIDDVPILINNGYCAPAIVYDALAVGLAQNGRRVIRPHATRHVSLPKAMMGGHLWNPLKKHSQANWEVVKDVKKRLGI